MGGIATMFWKEVHERLRGGRPTVGFVASAIFAVLVGAVLPILLSQGSRPPFLGAVLVSGSLFLVAFFALTAPLATVVDTVAGERERHTLETLLASPLRNTDIILGKTGAILAGVGLHIGMYLVCTTFAILYVFGWHGFALAGILWAASIPTALATATFTTGLGFLLSLHAPTVKQGQQWLSYALMPFLVLPGFAGAVVPAIAKGPPVWVLVLSAIVGVAVFLVMNALCWVLVFKRFRRDRLLGR